MDTPYETRDCVVSVDEIIEFDLEGFLDTLSQRAFDSCLLMNISYKPTEIDGDGNITLAVTGDTTTIRELDEEDDDDS